jgi:hypothetical protein
MAEDSVTDSAPVAEAAPSEVAVEHTDATHGDTSEQAAPTDGDESVAADSESDSSDEDEESDEHLNEEEKTRAQKRRERRQQREQERIAQAVQDTLAQERKAAADKAAADKATADAKAAQESWQKAFEQDLGSPKERADIQSEINALISQVVGIKPEEASTTEDYNAAIERLNAAQATLAKKQDRLREIDTNQTTFDKINAHTWELEKGGWLTVANSLPSDWQTKFDAATSIPQALSILEQGIVAREAVKAAADKAAAVEATRKEWQGKYEREAADHAATRTGAPGAGPTPGGNGMSSSNGRVYTRERLREMTATAEGRAEYRANRAEIERQEAAGLIR